MSLIGRVSGNNGGRSKIKNLINKLITEIEREHGLESSELSHLAISVMGG